ncbi:aldehyde dehydrogenase (NADP(+)) [Allonocardiopsis opalescens]|uniref:NADP-dependent aldehyde dehydrogenase n=1 Tax=Allonocardiopsis opalescens TaxID=1144618 RepID=A0A2T0PZ40_9ACTN|nr:aldehyde dehydrogenase (NADP(+)) [Allonocardiopsis opalescens]PRX96791.1 NADP-dependent aldehyde dehydrogenase [Allonocardiopsis opalescens]
MAPVISYDPRTGKAVEEVIEESTTAEADAACVAARDAAPALEAMGRSGRARLLRGLADALEADRAGIVALADRETALGETRLNGELTRTCYQLRMFAEVLDEGSYLEAAIDHAGDTPMGPRPDLRRMLVPLGPVAVFGASNFPLAFSVPGGDTASALAAGCPVVVKAHPSHPATSQRCFEVMRAAAEAAGAPVGTLGLVHGQAAGAALVEHPAVRAVGFTGSLTGGRALADIAASRPDPIPFYGELSSINPVVVTPSAAEERGADIGSGLAGSVLLGAGQFCTKPGLVFVPAGEAGRALTESVSAAVTEAAAGWALNSGIAGTFRAGVAGLSGHASVATAASGGQADGDGYAMSPTVLATSATELTPDLVDECFGPVTLLVAYASEAELLGALRRLPGSLTATLHTADGDEELTARLTAVLRPRAGRILFGGFPTGVAVSWAQHHGGPWPSTNSQHTSVGATAIRRFLRPVTWQNAPEHALPAELREQPPSPLPRRIDGRLVLP